MGPRSNRNDDFIWFTQKLPEIISQNFSHISYIMCVSNVQNKYLIRLLFEIQQGVKVWHTKISLSKTLKMDGGSTFYFWWFWYSFYWEWNYSWGVTFWKNNRIRQTIKWIFFHKTIIIPHRITLVINFYVYPTSTPHCISTSDRIK